MIVSPRQMEIPPGRFICPMSRTSRLKIRPIPQAVLKLDRGRIM
jgi:hypothetical protein